MKYTLEKALITGVAIPVSALKTKDSLGVGEFLDLIYFADWCKITKIDLIQLLPVNDTGFQSSPYSALSAFALHPIYIKISDIPQSKEYKKDIKKIKDKWDNKEKVHFHGVLKDKLGLLKTIFLDNLSNIKLDKNLLKWTKDNNWIKTYSVFSFLKREK